jgi:hypothetical protein
LAFVPILECLWFITSTMTESLISNAGKFFIDSTLATQQFRCPANEVVNLLTKIRGIPRVIAIRR